MNSIPQSSQQLVELLKSKSLHISAAESCTAGLFSSSLASIPGASSVMEYGFVTYSAATKTNLVSVKPDTIKNYTVYSGPVTAQMAIGAAQNLAQSLALVSPALQVLMRNLSLPALSISPWPIRRSKMFSFAAIFFRITTATSSAKKPSLLPWILSPPSSLPPAASPTLPGLAALLSSIP